MEGKKVKIKYLLSEEGRKKSLLSGGDGKAEQVIEAPLTPEALEISKVDVNGNAVIRLTERLASEVKLQKAYSPHITEFDKKFEFDSPQTAEQLINFEKERRVRIAMQKEALQPALEAALEEAAREKERAEREAERQAEYEAEQAKRKAAKRERLEKEKLAWISEYGSDYLQRAVKLGYNCQRQYVTERAAKEFPGYALDFNNNATWKDRACPSMAALEEVERLIRQGYDAEVVWLTEPIQESEYSDDDDYCCFEPCETIVVRNYLGKYDLVKEI